MVDDLIRHDNAEVIVACGNMLGESPIWVAADQSLYWVDILKPAIWRLELPSQFVEHWTPPFRLTSLVSCGSSGLFGAGDAGLLALNPAANRYDVFGHPEGEVVGNRFNDGGVDCAGGYWLGSMDQAEQAARGTIYRIGRDRRWRVIDTGFRVPNGPAFSPDGQHAYLADSPLGIIYRYTLEPDGRLLTREEFLRFSQDQGFPDGMTTDANGCLWVSFWDGGCLRCFNPDGTQLRQIDLPVPRPTSCAFGGEALDLLFVTSARTGLSEAQLAAAPASGALLCVRPGVHGWPLPSFAG